jgi:hypothetical protein
MKKIFTLMLALVALLITPGFTKAQTCADLYGPGYIPLHIEVTTDNYPYETSFALKDGCSGAVLFESGPLGSPNTLYTIDFCTIGNFEFVISDAFGDGICCANGNGSYSVSSDGVIVGSGGSFGSSESVFFGNGAPCPPAPSNDNCADAIKLNCGDVVTGSTVGARVESETFCGTYITGSGVWYHFTGNGNVAALSTCSFANYDTKISVFTGSCGAFNCVGGNDDACGVQSTVSLCTEAGTEYYVLVHGFSNYWGDFELSLSCNQPVNGGDAVGSVIICGSGSVFLQALGYTVNTSLQWQQSATSGGPYTNISGETSDIYYNGAVSQTTFYVLTATCGSSTGTSTEAFAFVASPPANDNICNARALTMGAITPFDNTCATVEAGEPAPGAGSDVNTFGCQSQNGWCYYETTLQNTVWFKFVTPASKAVTIRSSFDFGFHDTQLALWKSSAGCSGVLSLVAANDDRDDNNFDYSSEITPVYCLQPNTTYYVQVDGFFGTTGPGTVIVQEVTDKKVLVCHRTGNGNKTVTLSVSGCALAAHLAHGDALGNCASGKTDESILSEGDASVSSYVDVYPNPFSEKATIEFGTAQSAANVKLEIFNVIGQKIATLFEGSMEENEIRKVDFIPADLASQVFVYVLKTDSEIHIGKLNMLK